MDKRKHMEIEFMDGTIRETVYEEFCTLKSGFLAVKYANAVCYINQQQIKTFTVCSEKTDK